MSPLSNLICPEENRLCNLPEKVCNSTAIFGLIASDLRHISFIRLANPQLGVHMAILDWILLGVYFGLLVLIGVQTMRRVKSPDDFAVAGIGSSGPSSSEASLLPFWAGGASLGMAGAAMRDGYVYKFAFCAFGVQTVLVGYFGAPKLKNYVGAHTLGDVMETHYGKPARLVTGVLSVVLCAGILGAQALAIGTVVNATWTWVVPSVIIGMGVVVLYSSFGGAWAVIQTDMLQFVFLGVLLPVALLIGLDAVGGPSALIELVPSDHLTFMGDYTQFSSSPCLLRSCWGRPSYPRTRNEPSRLQIPVTQERATRWPASFPSFSSSLRRPSG